MYRIVFPLFCVLLLGLAGCSNKSENKSENLASQIELIKVRIEPVLSGNRLPTKAIKVDWRNRGPVEIGRVYAEIHVFDSSGRRMVDSTDDYCIFTSDVDTGIKKMKAGELWRGHEGWYVVEYSGPVARVNVRIVNAQKLGFDELSEPALLHE